MFLLVFHALRRLNLLTSTHLPTNRLIRRLRIAGPAMTVATSIMLVPTYLFALSFCATIVEAGGPGYLNALVLLLGWNAAKFFALAILVPCRYC